MNRLCAAAKRPGSCALTSIIFSLAALVLLSPNVATGEPREDEVSIGTFNLTPRPAAALAGETEEQKLFDDAMVALKDGQGTAAQRLFEKLIALAPDGVLAGKARNHLAELYRMPPGALVAKQDPVGAAQGSDREDQQMSSGRSLLGGPGAKEELADTQSHAEVPVALEERFIAEAGDRVFFSSGSAELGSRARGVLQAQARFIKLRPFVSASIEGHADDAPLSSEEHIRLSEARAEAVRQRLIEEGIDASRITVTSWGRDKRVSECPDPACAAQNRRAVTVLISARARRTDGPSGRIAAPETVVAREPALLTH